MKVPIVVVEGPTDRRALFPFLADLVRVIAADNKEQVLTAFAELEQPLRDGVIFLVDCDGGVDDQLKGHQELVITTNRDIEADLLLELHALKRVALEVLASPTLSPGSVQKQADQALRLSSELAINLGIVQSAARDLDLPTRVLGARSGKRRKLRLEDLPGMVSVVAKGDAPSPESLIADIAPLTGWSATDQGQLKEAVGETLASPCAKHKSTNCLKCQRQLFCNGHHLVDAIALVLHTRHKVKISPKQLDQALRIGADRLCIPDWEVARRIKAWEAASRRKVMA